MEIVAWPFARLFITFRFFYQRPNGKPFNIFHLLFLCSPMVFIQHLAFIHSTSFAINFPLVLWEYDFTFSFISLLVASGGAGGGGDEGLPTVCYSFYLK